VKVFGILGFFQDAQALIAKADYLSQQGIGIGGFLGLLGFDEGGREMVVRVAHQSIFGDFELSRYVAKRPPLDQGLVDGRALLMGADRAFAGHVDPPQAPNATFVASCTIRTSSTIRKIFSRTGIVGS
jgi:hypothetical protein